jgi:hypothetical protein
MPNHNLSDWQNETDKRLEEAALTFLRISYEQDRRIAASGTKETTNNSTDCPCSKQGRQAEQADVLRYRRASLRRFVMAYTSSRRWRLPALLTDTFYAWHERGRIEPDSEYGEFSRRYKSSIDEAERTALGVVRKGDPGWQSNAWFLERRFPKRWTMKSDARNGKTKEAEFCPALIVVSERKQRPDNAAA